jgi:hypothetical protein
MSAPSSAQVAFARDLGIEEPERLDREELRWEIKAAQERRDAHRVTLKLVAPRPPAAASETPSRASEEEKVVVKINGRDHVRAPRPKVPERDHAFFEAMAECFERELDRWSTREAAIRATVVRFDCHEVLRHRYPAAVLEAIKETGWGGLDE